MSVCVMRNANHNTAVHWRFVQCVSVMRNANDISAMHGVAVKCSELHNSVHFTRRNSIHPWAVCTVQLSGLQPKIVWIVAKIVSIGAKAAKLGHLGGDGV